ncbi:MAG: helix-turn-helix transcriptional regulator [Kiritimatiellae bacterium]|nr:helix-turn-helix transcriptional regulator [Kiritimatiellia bacterium]
MTVRSGQTLTVLASDRIVYFLGDQIEIELPNGTRETIGEGDALSARNGSTYHFRPLRGKSKTQNQVLVVRFSSAVRETDPSRSREYDRLFGEDVRLFPDALNRGSARTVVQLIRREGEKTHTPNPMLISGLCMALVAGLLEPELTAPSPPPHSIDRGAAAAEHAKQFMRECCHEKLSLTQIAWEVHLSGEHLERLFKKHYGVTVFDYLDALRIEKAKDLLRTTDLPVVRIAPVCGFSSANLLGRHFKSRTGMTPLGFRLHERESERFAPSLIGKSEE